MDGRLMNPSETISSCASTTIRLSSNKIKTIRNGALNRNGRDDTEVALLGLRMYDDEKARDITLYIKTSVQAGLSVLYSVDDPQ